DRKPWRTKCPSFHGGRAGGRAAVAAADARTRTLPAKGFLSGTNGTGLLARGGDTRLPGQMPSGVVGCSTPTSVGRASHSGGAAPVFHRTSGRPRSCYVGWSLDQVRRQSKGDAQSPAQLTVSGASSATGAPTRSQRSRSIRRHLPSAPRPTASYQRSLTL